MTSDTDEFSPELRDSPWRMGHAVVWWLCGGLALCGGAALAQLFPPVEPPYRFAPASEQVSVLVGWAAIGVVVALVVTAIRAGRSATALAAIGGATVAACFLLAPLLGLFPAFALVGVLAGAVGHEVSRPAAVEPPARIRFPWYWSHALAWSVTGALMLCVVGTLSLPLRGPGLGTPGLTSWKAVGVGAAAGLVAGLVVSAIRRLRSDDGAALTLIAVLAGAGCELLAPELVKVVGSPDGFVAAFALVGLSAGYAGYAVSLSYTAGRPVADDTALVPIPTPGFRAALVALAFVVAAIAGRPSSVGWLVLAVGGFGLLLAAALIGQEGRIAELEERIRTLERARQREDGQDAPPGAELD